MTKRAYDEEQLGELLGRLQPAPRAWVHAAHELPPASRVLDELVSRAEQDLAFRDALVADLEAALAREGVDPGPRVLDALRRRLSR